jgi:lysophospholipid acyltransferase (LPLAT)-like uncharacterized protein
VAALALRAVLGLLSSTYRYRVAHPERLEALVAGDRPVVLSFWHDQTIAASWFLLRRLHRRGVPLTLLASLSRDGEMVARIGRALKLRVVRGSASRGGRAAILGLYRELVDHGSTPLVVPDGPRGPAHVAKVGAVVLAKMSSCAILPLAAVPERYWRIGSWDRMFVPRPFSRVHIVVGEPLRIARESSGNESEARRAELEHTLSALVARGEGLARSRPSGQNGGRGHS